MSLIEERLCEFVSEMQGAFKSTFVDELQADMNAMKDITQTSIEARLAEIFQKHAGATNTLGHIVWEE